ncbi:hypothetical protein [Dyadobacter jiangsuensis]|uniref:Uncharacterized protein n=1 Tax=Dyadobacter jiangsuensis TaxID=1591085 RepID=A0A2P8FN43_9BACT|nr:hypothetical protein [Dyadobacter jiangsuensis]PSL23158.1 hypothetical protein CLV60_11735 [Dyadobacter jiangsuensis]
MKHFTRITFLALFLIPTLTTAQQTEEQQVKKTFDAYKSAILNDKGEEAVEQVDTKTINYYGNILEKVKTADSLAVDKLTLMDKLMVLIIRHRISKDEILTTNGKQLLVTAIKMGMVGKSSVMNNEVGVVKVNGNFATGELLVRGQKTPLAFEFNKENGTWKLDLTAVFPAGEAAFRQMVKQSGEPENAYLLSLIELTSGKGPGAEVWVPVKQ